MTAPILFSIIIVNFNKAGNLKALFSSIFENYHANDFEVIFMDDASTDQSVEIAGMYPLRIQTGLNNKGPALLRNIGAEMASGEYLLFLDSDVILLPQTLSNFRDKCLQKKYSAYIGLEVLPPVIDNFIGRFRTLFLQEVLGFPGFFEKEVGGWGSTFGAMKKEIFFELGGFDISYRKADVEDLELGMRLTGKYNVLFCPSLQYRHTYPSTLDLLRKQFSRAAQVTYLSGKMLLNSKSLYNFTYKLNCALSFLLFISFILFCIFGNNMLLVLAFLIVLFLGIIHKNVLAYSWNRFGLLFSMYYFCMAVIICLPIAGGVFAGMIKKSWIGTGKC